MSSEDGFDRRPKEEAGDRDPDQYELDELRQELTEQTRQVIALTAKLALMARRERELRELLLDAHDQLLRRDEELQVTLAAALDQQALASPGATQRPLLASSHVRYKSLIQQIRDVVATIVPPDATVAVVSRGDDELLELGGRRAWHFPQTDDGRYAGHHPADSGAAIEQLEALKLKGADFLLFPATAFWWLEHYSEFTEHLRRSYRRVGDGESCDIFALREPPAPTEYSKADYHELVGRVREAVHGSVPEDATVLVVSRGDDALLDLHGRRAWHFPRAEDGRWAGHYPKTSKKAVKHLKRLRRAGATHLVFPATSLWWLGHYEGLRRHLGRRASEVSRTDAGVVFSLQRQKQRSLLRRTDAG